MSSRADGERDVSRARYKVVKKAAKKTIAVAKSLAYDRLYRRLGTKEGEKDVFKLARARERRTRDLDVMRCIKDENGKELFEGAEIKERWQRYFSDLLHGVGMEDSRSKEQEGGERSVDQRLCRRISKNEIKEAMRKMPKGKVEGRD